MKYCFTFYQCSKLFSTFIDIQIDFLFYIKISKTYGIYSIVFYPAHVNTSVSDSKLFHKIHKDPPFFTLWYNGVTLEIDIPIYLQTPFELDLHITHIITNTFNIYTIYYSQYIVNSNTAKHICSVPSKINNKKDLCLGCFYIVYNTESCIGSAKIA